MKRWQVSHDRMVPRIDECNLNMDETTPEATNTELWCLAVRVHLSAKSYRPLCQSAHRFQLDFSVQLNVQPVNIGSLDDFRNHECRIE